MEETLDLHGSSEWFIACWNRELEKKKKKKTKGRESEKKIRERWMRFNREFGEKFAEI